MKKVITAVCTTLVVITICTVLYFNFFSEPSKAYEPIPVATEQVAEIETMGLISTTPPTTVPVTTEPVTTEPVTTEPVTTEPVSTEPDFRLLHSSKSKLPLASGYEIIEKSHPYSGYHPKVLDMGENGWNGYRYWVSYTPYPAGLDYYENAHVIASNDLISYSEIKHFEEPLNNHKKSVRFNSDSHLVYNDDLDRLELFWRYTDYDADYMALYMKYSEDGTNWSDTETFYMTFDMKSYDMVSPAIIYENGTYKIWYVKSYSVFYREYRDGVLTEPVKTNLKYENNARTWHIDVIKTDKGYELLSCATEDLNDRKHMSLYYTTSIDGMNWDNAKLVLTPSDKERNWDGGGLYRSSFMYSDGMYYVLYSGKNDHKEMGTGLVFGKDMYNLYGTDLDFIKNGPDSAIKFWKFINTYKTYDFIPKYDK